MNTHQHVSTDQASVAHMYPSRHEYFMVEAIREAEKARQLDEVPIGAVVVKDGQIIGRGHNKRERTHDATMHAEIQAIRQANQWMTNWRLESCDLYVTLEPCVMCSGAILWARLRRVYFGPYDPKGGAGGSIIDVLSDNRFNHTVPAVGNILPDQCRYILQSFFKALRQHKKRTKNREVKHDDARDEKTV